MLHSSHTNWMVEPLSKSVNCIPYYITKNNNIVHVADRCATAARQIRDFLLDFYIHYIAHGWRFK